MSSALGAPHSYGSQDNDQSNLSSLLAGASGGSLWCSTGAPANWTFSPHTAAQLTQVNTDWVAFLQALQQKYASLLIQVKEASTVAAVNAVTW
jgi:hypothetical protein